jgi:hypothetical protein
MNKLSYRILEVLCSIDNNSTSKNGNVDPYTNRVNFIIDTILDLNLLSQFKLNVDIFENFTNDNKYANIELSLNNNKDESVILIANHDIKDVYSESCNNNSSSIANLLALSKHICNNTNDYKNKNIHIVFTDCANYGNKGAMRLVERIHNNIFGNVKYVINLQMTSNGSKIWKDGFNFSTLNNRSLLNEKLEKHNIIDNVETSFNDSFTIRQFGIDCMSIGTIDDKQLNEIKYTGTCKSWQLSGEVEDVFEKNANAVDMDKFVDLLTRII